MIVRSAVRHDIAAVSALETVLFGGDAWSAAVVDGELASDLRRSVVAEIDGAVVGYAILFVVGDTADLERVGVDPRHQRLGIGTTLLAALDLDRVPRVLLEVRSDNRPAIRLYESTGFGRLATRRRYYADGCDAFLMQRTAGQRASAPLQKLWPSRKPSRR